MEKQNENNGHGYDEIDLRGLILVLINGIWVIVILAVLGAAIGFYVANSAPKVYRTQMLLEIGAIGTGVPVESIAVVKDKINQGFYSLQAEKEGIAVYSVSASGGADSSIISLSATAPAPQAAADFLSKISNLVVADHNKEIAVRRASIDTRAAEVRSNIEEVKKDTRFACQSEKYAALNNMEELLASLEMAKTQFSDTSVISAPALPTSPAKTNVKINIAFGAIVGLLAGLAIVFFRNWWKKSA